MRKKIISLLLGIMLISSVSAFGLGVDTSSWYSDDYGWFFYIGFPFTQGVIDYIISLGIVEDIFVDEDGVTLIDVNDETYETNQEVINKQIDQLSFIQWFQYVNHAYRFVSPIEKIYMKATDGNVVECQPHDDNEDGIYEMICWDAS